MYSEILYSKNIIYRQNVNLKNYNTFRLSSVARHFYIAKNIEGLIAFKKNMPKGSYIILGGGSNIIFAKKYIDKNIIYTGMLDKIHVNENTLIAEAGVSIHKLLGYAYNNSLSKLEFLSALPAKVGGIIYMNARCYGSEISHVIKSVGIIDENNQYRRITKEECEFSYKKSVFQKKDYIIVNAEFALEKEHKEKIKNLMLKYKNDRINKHQFDYPSAGCIFLNDYNTNMVAGRIIDKANMKGVCVGGAMVLKTHGNFIVNRRHASGSDIVKLINIVKESVKKKTGIELYEEAKITE